MQGEDWHISWAGGRLANAKIFSFTESYPDFDLKKVAAHGKEVGVKRIAHHVTSGGITNYDAQLEDVSAL